MPVRMHDTSTLISHERLTSLVRYDPVAGEFRWLVARQSYGGRRLPGSLVTGCIDRHGYQIIGLDRRRYQASRLAWFYVHKQWPQGEVDHVNRNPLDNRLANLRDTVTRSMNRANQKVRANSTTGVKGVSMGKRGKFRVRCAKRHIGTYATLQEAQDAYMRAACKAFGEFARASTLDNP